MIDPEALAAQLECNKDYRVLRRIKPLQLVDRNADPLVKHGLVIDTETTGLDPATDVIIEIGLLAFDYQDGEVLGATGVYSGFHDPGRPIPPEITKLTGIDDAMVASKRFDDVRIAELADEANVVIAHNAAFDRKFVEAMAPLFIGKPWACSMSQVAWKSFGFQSQRLGGILADFGRFHDGHRALDDCRATLEILSRVPDAGDIDSKTALAHMIATARQSTYRVIAEGAPFATKDLLKSRGYFWSDGTGGKPKAWCRDVTKAQMPDEWDWLASEIYRSIRHPARHRLISAFDRFSVRADLE